MIAPITSFPPTTGAKCELHRYHRPKPVVNELHHVLPRSWQYEWSPPDVKAGMLWYPRTVAICPTGHRVTHTIISAMMHLVIGHGVERAVDLAKQGQYGRYSEFATAEQALVLWEGFGGSFAELAERGLWGQS